MYFASPTKIVEPVNNPNGIPDTLKFLGKAYVFQEDFTGRPTDLEATKANWKKAGHGVMVKRKTRLYVTPQKTRGY